MCLSKLVNVVKLLFGNQLHANLMKILIHMVDQSASLTYLHKDLWNKWKFMLFWMISMQFVDEFRCGEGYLVSNCLLRS